MVKHQNPKGEIFVVDLLYFKSGSNVSSYISTLLQGLKKIFIFYILHCFIHSFDTRTLLFFSSRPVLLFLCMYIKGSNAPSPHGWARLRWPLTHGLCCATPNSTSEHDRCKSQCTFKWRHILASDRIRHSQLALHYTRFRVRNMNSSWFDFSLHMGQYCTLAQNAQITAPCGDGLAPCSAMQHYPLPCAVKEISVPEWTQHDATCQKQGSKWRQWPLIRVSLSLTTLPATTYSAWGSVIGRKRMQTSGNRPYVFY